MDDPASVRERLKPFIRAIADFDDALSSVGAIRADIATLNAEIPKLKAEREQLQKETETQRLALAQLLDEHDHRVAATEKERAVQVAAKEKQVQELNDRILAAETQHKHRMEEMEREFKERATALRNEVADLEAKRDAAKEAFRQSKEAVMHL